MIDENNASNMVSFNIGHSIKKMKNSDILQENAIEFMDKAEQFVNEFRKL